MKEICARFVRPVRCRRLTRAAGASRTKGWQSLTHCARASQAVRRIFYVPGTDSAADLAVVSFKARRQCVFRSLSFRFLLTSAFFSDRVDLSGAGFTAESLDHPWANFPSVVTSKTGNQPASGLLDQAGTGPRFFSRKATDVQVWVGTTGWDAAEETLPDNGDEEETV